MRSELRIFEEKHPTKINVRFYIKSSILKVQEWLFMQKIKKIIVGSPQWHIFQEKLSHGSAVGLDMWKRNTFYECTLPNCGKAIFVHPSVYMCYPENIQIGYNVFINRGAYLTAPTLISIGDNSLIGPYAILNSGSHLYHNPNKLIRDQGHKLGPIRIESDVWIGANVYISPNVTVGQGSIVAANSVVTQSVEPYSIVAGIPAKAILYRRAKSKEN